MNRSRCKEPEYLAKEHKHDADVPRCSAKDPRYSATLSLSFSLFFSRSRTLSLSFSLDFSCSRTLFLSFTSIQVRPSDEQLWLGTSCPVCMDHVLKSPNILQTTPDILQESVCVSMSLSCPCFFPLSITRIQVRQRDVQLWMAVSCHV